MHAEEDKQKKDKMEALNQAESTIYQTEKTITDMGDKISASEKESVEAAIASLKEIKDKSDATGEQIRAEIDKVMEAIHPISQKMYEQAQADAQAQAQQGEQQSSEETDDVVDADYEVVDEDK